MAEPAQPAATSLSCPNCGGTVTLRAAGYTVTVACEYCGSILDVSRPEVQLVTRYREEAARLPIPLGSRGTFDGIEWEIIGWMGREDSGYPWQEYLLFNPYHGYRWLIEQRGGWSLGEQLTVNPKGGFRGIEVEGERYQPFFAEGHARVEHVVGEFYWRVKRGDTVRTDDWVRPGAMLSREADDREVSWSRSRWLPTGTVDRAFGIKGLSRKPWPPLPHQPSPALSFLKQGCLVAVAAILLMIMIGVIARGHTTLYRGSVEVAADGREQQASVGPFELPSARQRVRVRADVPALSNGWVDMGYTLVNRADQRRYVAEKAAERYSGRDSDGSWSEGSGEANADFAGIPGGTYDLVIDYKGNNWVDPSQPTTQTSLMPWSFGERQAAEAPDWRRGRESAPRIDVEVIRLGGAGGGVMFVMILLIAVPWLIGIVIHLHFESARARESDFASGGGDED